MKYNSSTLYNWLSDDSCSKTQLHIYAVESEEEYQEDLKIKKMPLLND